MNKGKELKYVFISIMVEHFPFHIYTAAIEVRIYVKNDSRTFYNILSNPTKFIIPCFEIGYTDRNFP